MDGALPSLTRVPASPALPVGAVLAHVGLPKTGTTALQAALADRRGVLSAHAVCYPGDGRQHHAAAFAVTQSTAWSPRRGVDAEPPPMTAWHELIRQIGKRPGTDRIVISSEYFSDARGAQLHQFVDDLGPDRVHIALGVRHVGQVATSIWQQSLKRGRTWSLDRWLKRIYVGERDHPQTYPRGFWNRYAYGDTVQRWADLVGPERLHVMVVDDADRSRQVRVFEELLALPPGSLTEGPPGAADAARLSNRSMTADEAEALRQANGLLLEHLPWREYEHVLTRGALPRMLEHRRPGPQERPIVLPEWAFEIAHEEGQRAAERIREIGVVVHGDLEALTRQPSRPSGDSVSGDDVVRPATATVPIEALSLALAGAVIGATRGQPTYDEPPQPESGLIAGATSGQLLRVIGRRAVARSRSMRHRRPSD